VDDVDDVDVLLQATISEIATSLQLQPQPHLAKTRRRRSEAEGILVAKDSCGILTRGSGRRRHVHSIEHLVSSDLAPAALCRRKQITV
jgi:hypothetical protein